MKTKCGTKPVKRKKSLQRHENQTALQKHPGIYEKSGNQLKERWKNAMKREKVRYKKYLSLAQKMNPKQKYSTCNETHPIVHL